MTDAAMATGGPFRIGPIFGRAWSIYIANFVKFTAVAIAIALPQLFFGRDHIAIENVPGLVVLIVIAIIFYFVGQAVILYGAFQAMRGRTFLVGEAARRGLSRVLWIIAIAFLVTLGVAIGFLLLIVPGIILAVRWSVAVPACVVENLGPLAAMRRSAELTRGHRWKIFLVYILFVIITFVVSLIVGLLAGLVVGALTVATGTDSVTIAVTGGVFGLIGTALYAAYENIVVSMVYHDLRVAKEGVDTDQIAAVFD
jgi:hypothetical protein